jgi:hypothetical protein
MPAVVAEVVIVPIQADAAFSTRRESQAGSIADQLLLWRDCLNLPSSSVR